MSELPYMRSVARGHFRNMPQTVNFCSYSEVASFIENLEQLSTSRFITQRLSNRRHFTLQPDGNTDSTQGRIQEFQNGGAGGGPGVVEFLGLEFVLMPLQTYPMCL